MELLEDGPQKAYSDRDGKKMVIYRATHESKGGWRVRKASLDAETALAAVVDGHAV